MSDTPIYQSLNPGDLLRKGDEFGSICNGEEGYAPFGKMPPIVSVWYPTERPGTVIPEGSQIKYRRRIS